MQNDNVEHWQTGVRAYLNERFVKGSSARVLRILAEYLERTVANAQRNVRVQDR